jgi:heptosyltransferase-2
MQHTFVPQNILVVKHRALGDSIIGLSSIAYLKSIFPNAKVTFALAAWTVDLYRECETPCDAFIELKLDSLKGAWRFYRTLAKGRFDLVIELHQSGRTFKIINLASRFMGFHYVYHNHNLKKGHFIKDQGVRKPILQRDLDTCWSALKHLGYEDLPVPNYLDWSPSIKPLKTKERQKPVVVLGVVASRPDKQWPLGHFIELMRFLKSMGHDLHFLIPLSNSQADQELATHIQNEAIGLSYEILQLPLSQLAEHLANAKFYLGNDTGLKHLCVALGFRTLTFFGPEEPLEWNPYDLEKHPYLWSQGQDARTQMALTCALVQFDLSRKLEEISPIEVYEVLKNQSLL